MDENLESLCEQLDELCQAIVGRSPGSWKEKRDAIAAWVRERGGADTLEFLSWWDEETINGMSE